MASRLSIIGVFAALLTASLSGRVVAIQRADSENVSCRPAGSLVMLSGLSEASGVAASQRNPGLLWSHNDSGLPMLFAIGTDGTMKGQVPIAAAQVDDWEDVAVG